MAKLIDIEGIGPKYAETLKKAGISSQNSLLEKGSTPSGRKKIAQDAGLNEKMVLEWVNRADLSRVKGIGEEYADLLEAAGVDTVPELARRNAENLFSAIQAVNGEKKLVRQLPTNTQVEGWISQAKALPRKVEY
jgi:predicted flap endonuclease-1-like 5' DNA nuclease